jgi:hypothetical protein
LRPRYPRDDTFIGEVGGECWEGEGGRMSKINFNIKKFEYLKDEKWKLGNNILYKMCSDYPKHTNPEEIRAKIWLIGRSYAAAIERRTKKEHINDDFYDYVVEEFVKFNKENKFDEKLSKLKNVEFNEDSIKDIIKIHKELTDFFEKLTGKEKRSLASKYLHFHCPVFPIFDSRANNSIRKIVKGKIKKFEGDEQYSKFCDKMLELCNLIKKESGKTPTSREVDTYLVRVANKEMKEDKKL